MSLIKKEHDFLICFDSDGTVMDTMTIKHEKCFGPAFVKVFDIRSHEQEIIDHWSEINLYTKDRGMNRFLGLKEIIEFTENFGYEFKGKEYFNSWLQTTSRYSVDAIREVLDENDTESVLYKAVVWSNEVNAMIKTMPEPKPFDGVCEYIAKLSQKADLVGVSSAPKEAVYSEWKNVGIFDYFKLVACQDFGKKGDIIKRLLECGYDKDKVIMLGDATGDKNAADKNGVLFYPLVAKQENEYWKLFIETYAKKFFNGTYKGECQKELENKFFEVLK